MQNVRNTILGAALLAPVLVVPANAAEGWYGKVSIGQNINTEVSGIQLNDDMTYGAAVGTAVGPVRVEAGVDRVAGDLNLGFASVQANALDWSVTGYLDLPVGDNASVFGGLGVGYIDAEANAFGTTIDGSGTEWHYAVGGAYRLNDRLIVEAQYRHTEADSISTDFVDVDLSFDAVTAGFRLAL